MSRTRVVWTLIVIMSVGSALRSYDLSARSIWFDESFTWRLIQFPISELISRTAVDVHPPLYYILVKSWAVVFGSSILALRSFSVVCAALSIAGAYLFTAQAFRSKRAGLFAAALLAFSPWTIAYAWEARMYTLGMVLAIFSSLALFIGIRKQSFFWFAVYGLLAAAFMYTHYYALFTILAQILAVSAIILWQTKARIGEIAHTRIFWGMLLSVFVAFLIFAPWLPEFMQQRSQVQAQYWVPRITVFSIPDTLYRLFIPTIDLPYRTGVFAALLVLPACVTLIIWIVLAFWKRHNTHDGAYLTLALGIIPFISGIAISLGSRSLYNDRFFAFAGMFIFIAIAGIVDRIASARVRTSVMLLIIAFFGWAHIRSWRELDVAHAPGVRGAMQYSMEHRKSNNPLITSSPYIYFPLLYYAQEEFHEPSSVHLYTPSGELSHFSGAPITIAADIATSSDIAAYTDTVWVIDTTGFTEKPFEAPKYWQEKSKIVFPELLVHQGDVIVRKFDIPTRRSSKTP